ncbi:MAG: exosortase/archaeosortase family protein [Phycisphaerae bacterium]|nr:exosortase/archaeosortase family protein [Phycisphaerae bacterium]
MSTRAAKTGPGSTGKHGGYAPAGQDRSGGAPHGHGQGGQSRGGMAVVGVGGNRDVNRWSMVAVLAVGFVWSYWPTLTALWNQWQINQDYSAGQLVPLVALYVIWSQRAELAKLPVQACWWGLAVLAVSQLARMAGVLMGYGSVEQYSVVLALFGLTLFTVGYPITRRLIWVFAFMLLLAPLPRRIHDLLAMPMQSFATSSAVFGLELLGYLIERHGNVLTLSAGNTIAVAEACSGLRMLTAFIMVGAALAFVIHRPVWQKAVLVLATIPVAVLANTLRLIVTAVLYESVNSEVGEKFFHDFAGLTMMPFAFAVLIGLLWGMKWVSVKPAASG